MASLAQATRISSLLENSQHFDGNVDQINETLDLIKDVSKSWSDVMSKNFLQIFIELGMTKEKFPKFFIGKTGEEVVNGLTILHIFAAHGNLEMVQIFIEKVDNKNPPTVAGDTPLHFAAEYGHTNVFQAIFERLQEKNPTTIEGTTPLHLAAEGGHYEICQVINLNAFSR
jgi:hypothetical protein